MKEGTDIPGQFYHLLASLWWNWTFHAFWQGLLVLLLVLIVFRLFPLSARWRYCLLLIALIKLALPPLGPAIVLPGGSPEKQEPGAQAGASRAESEAPAYSAAGSGPVMLFQSGIAQSPLFPPPDPSGLIEETPYPTKPEGTPESKTPKWKERLFALHLLGLSVMGVLTVALSAFFRIRLRTTGRTASGRMHRIAGDVAAEIGMAAPGIFVDSAAGCPQTCGLFRPCILLPGWAPAVSLEEQRVLLVHELAHILRRDPWINALQTALQAWLWWNPFAWWLNAWIRAEREHCCDDLVLALELENPKTYRKMMTRIARRIPPRAGFLEALGAVDAFRRMRQRVRRLRSGPRALEMFSPVPRSWAILLALAVVFMPDLQNERKREAALAVAPFLRRVPSASARNGVSALEHDVESDKPAPVEIAVPGTGREWKELEEMLAEKSPSPPAETPIPEKVESAGEPPTPQETPLAATGRTTTTAQTEPVSGDSDRAPSAVPSESKPAPSEAASLILAHPTEDGRIGIAPLRRWVDTGLDVRKGQVVEFAADGLVTGCPAPGHESYGPWGPEGGPQRVKNFYARICALTAKIEAEDRYNAFYVGKSLACSASLSGRLFLGVTDTYHEDNAGAFVVQVKLDGRPVDFRAVAIPDSADEPPYFPPVNYLGQKDYPTVVWLNPPNGAEEVEPGLQPIEVVFDRPMRSGYSWLTRFHGPEIAAVKWISDRRCAALAYLEPNRHYGIYLNRGPESSKFRSLEGVSADRVWWEFKTREATEEETADLAAREAVPSARGDLGPPTNYLGQKNYPRIVRMDPPNGADDVDPTRRSVTVIFDQPMRDTYSLADRGEIPYITSVRWISDRSCRIWVRLEPDRGYGIGLNCGPNLTKFVSRKGVSADRACWRFRTRFR